ncbi:MAG: AAA family ATPase [Methylococcales bacterium]|nr:AAA family ATPase [Methylococcales bacterium]
MYKNFYGFRDIPFSLDEGCEPISVYQSRNYTEEIPRIVNSLDNKVALTLVLGEAGVGKTSLINYMYSFCPQVFTASIIENPLNSTQELFQQVLTSFKQNVKKESTYDMLLQLSVFLSAMFKQHDGQPTLLIIDNADFMSIDVLKGIELLLGLNAKGGQILQIVLVGEPKLKVLLNDSGLSALLKNSTKQHILKPLTAEETQQYINHKIESVYSEPDKQDTNIFDNQACSRIYQYSKGNPTSINRVCDKALSYGSELQSHEINLKLILKVIDEKIQVTKKNTPVLTSLASTLGVVFVGIAVSYFISTSKELAEKPQKKESIDVEKSLAKINPNEPVGKIAKTHQKEETIIKQNIDAKKVQDEIVKATKGTEEVAEVEEIAVAATTIETQLAIAEQQMADFKFSFPRKDNAYESYTAILEAVPDEKRAIEGLQRITTYYVESAKKLLLSGNLERSQRSILKGLKITPNNEELIKLNEQISIEGKLAEKKNIINVLLKQADQQIDTLQFTKPLNDNAYKTYQEVIFLDKNNSQAKYGMLKILYQLKSQTQKSLAEEDFSAALETNKEILAFSSKGVSNPFHKKMIVEAFETQKIIVNNLLGVADKQLKKQQLTKPLGDNAFETYNKVLQIESNNSDAVNGLKNLNIKYQESALAALSAENTDLALTTVNEGLKVFPGNRELLAIQNNVILQQTEARKKTEDSKIKSKKGGRKLKPFGSF